MGERASLYNSIETPWLAAEDSYNGFD